MKERGNCKSIVLGAWTALMLGLVSPHAGAQEYPAKPIRIVVPVPPGAGPDVDIRPVAARLGSALGQSVVVENRPGAATRIAGELVAKSPADGYTLLVATPSLVTGPFLYAKLPYDPQRDFTPVSLVSTTAYALTVNATIPSRSVQEYIDQVKAGRAIGNVATYGVGTVPHLAGAWFAQVTGTDLKYIHYNTTPPFGDLVAGQTNVIFDALLPVLGNVKAGKLRVLAVTGKARNSLLPEVPTFAETGLAGFDPVVWIGIMAPAGTPRPIIDRLSAAIGEIARVPEIVAQRREGGSESVGSSADGFAAFLAGERKKWGAVIERLGLKLE